MLDAAIGSDRIVRDLRARLSLREPQAKSLDILADVLGMVTLGKAADIAATLTAVRDRYATVTDFERDFPSLCFALATGVGKTRLAGAFMAYLALTGRSRNFFVLAPNTTIYQKLVADLTPNTPKYVFKGIAEFAANPPVVVTGDTWDQSSIFIDAAQRNGVPVVNVFNVDKINKDVGRIRKLNEYIGESYFDHLAAQPDLVLLMDEAHRYRAKAAFRAIADLKPILGLELTATPKTVGANPKDFKNVIYSFGLGEAMEKGFVKEPAVATRANWNPSGMDEDQIERIKLQDGIHAHNDVKARLELYHRETGERLVHPFMLVVAQDTTHAQRLKEFVESDAFFGGGFKGKVIRVDSATGAEETEEAAQKLQALETDTATEVVIHVNKLKEGWDVTNLFTIVPLRASASDILTEQTLGRGLRLPFGQRTGVEAIDRLTVIAHDRFDAIIEAARAPGSLVKMKSVTIGEGGDISPTKTEVVVTPPLVESILTNKGSGLAEGQDPFPRAPFQTPAARAAATVTLDVISRMGRQLGGIEDLAKPEVQARIVEQVRQATRPVQGTLDGLGAPPEPDVAEIVKAVAQQVQAGTIEIPEIVVIPDGGVTFTFRDFDLENLSSIAYRPLDQEILMHQLRTEARSTISIRSDGVREERPEDYLVRELVVKPEVDYDAHADFLYKLAGQVVERLRSYLATEDEVERVLLQHARRIANEFIAPQMMQHYAETATTFRVEVQTGFQGLKSQSFAVPEGSAPRDFRMAVTPKGDTRKHVFAGFSKCCYALQKFHSDPERQFAVLLEGDGSVMRWVKPGAGQFAIWYQRRAQYEPDFVVETSTEKLICEVKARNEVTSAEVQDKAHAARVWVGRANEHAKATGKKQWRYLLVPDDMITGSATLAGIAATCTMEPIIEAAGSSAA